MDRTDKMDRTDRASGAKKTGDRLSGHKGIDPYFLKKPLLRRPPGNEDFDPHFTPGNVVVVRNYAFIHEDDLSAEQRMALAREAGETAACAQP